MTDWTCCVETADKQPACGKPVAVLGAWMFTNLQHALKYEDRAQPCEECVRVLRAKGVAT